MKTFLSIGMNRKIFAIGKTDFSIGTQASLYLPDNQLSSLYGKNPWACQAFIRVSPGWMRQKYFNRKTPGFIPVRPLRAA